MCSSYAFAETIVMNCPLDGEAYGRIHIPDE